MTVAEITITPLLEDDYDECLALWQVTEGLAPPPEAAELRRFLVHNPQLSQVARHGPELIGVVLTSFDGIRGMLSRLAIASAWRRQGVAGRLVAASLTALQAAGAMRAHILVFAENTGAAGFWQETGWERYPGVDMWGIHLDAPTG